MEKLNPIIEKLKSRPAFQLDIMDCVTDKVFQRAVNQVYLDKNHSGNVLLFIKSLQTKGLREIQLIPRLRNGNTSKPGGASVTVDLTGSTPQNNGTSATSQAPTQTPFFAGLNGAFGLGMPEILNGMTAERENVMLRDQIKQLTADFKEEKESKRKWRDRATDYQRTNDINKIKETTIKESSAVDKLLDTLASNPAMIPQLLGAFKGGGLNSPNVQDTQVSNPFEGYSEMKTALCEMIGQCPDSLCEDLATLISRVAEQDKVFIKELSRLLQTPNLKKVADNG